MSKMNELNYEIEQLYIEGYKPFTIAAKLEIPVDIVYQWIENESLGQEQFDPYETINS